MTNNSFFVEYNFEDSVSGFLCACTGSKIYNVEYYECVDRMIDDVCKLLKKRNAQVTFQSFSGFQSIDLLRLFTENSGTLSSATWKYNNYGYVSETITEDGIKATKGNIKKYVIQALDLFRAREAA